MGALRGNCLMAQSGSSTAGRNDSMDTMNKVASQAAPRSYDLRVIGLPKTVDNDLAGGGAAIDIVRPVAYHLARTAQHPTLSLGNASPIGAIHE